MSVPLGTEQVEGVFSTHVDLHNLAAVLYRHSKTQRTQDIEVNNPRWFVSIQKYARLEKLPNFVTAQNYARMQYQKFMMKNPRVAMNTLVAVLFDRTGCTVPFKDAEVRRDLQHTLDLLEANHLTDSQEYITVNNDLRVLQYITEYPKNTAWYIIGQYNI